MAEKHDSENMHGGAPPKRDGIVLMGSTVIEHETGFWQAVRQYPAATFWSAFFCIAVIMAGFDAQIITSFYALPAFQRKYGELVGHNGVESYEIPAGWQVSSFRYNLDPSGRKLSQCLKGCYQATGFETAYNYTTV